MSTSTTQEPNRGAEVLLRVRLSEELDGKDLAELTRYAAKVGSLETAVFTLIRSGLAKLTPKKGAKR